MEIILGFANVVLTDLSSAFDTINHLVIAKFTGFQETGLKSSV